MDNSQSSNYFGTEGDDSSSPNQTGTPERRLLLAILERAILDFVGNDKREVEEAEEWLFGDLENPSLDKFSFAWICEQLDLDLSKISGKIRMMPRRGDKKIAPWYFMKQMYTSQQAA